MPGVTTLETPACPSCLAPMVWSPVSWSWGCPSCWNKRAAAGPAPERELPPGAGAGDVIRDVKTGERFRLVPLPDPASPAPAEDAIVNDRAWRESVERRIVAAQGEARDNAGAWADMDKRVKALEGGNGHA